MKKILLIILLLSSSTIFILAGQNGGFINASDFGFSPHASGIENMKALQKSVEHGGTIIISKPGIYNIAGTVYLKSNTSLIFGNNTFLRKVDEMGSFSHVFLNEGALTKTFDNNITIDGLNIIVNDVDKIMTEVYGLRGQIAFFYIKDLKITRFRCLDLGKAQFCIHICTFEDIIIDDAIIKGKKDGIHLGRGKRFAIRNCVFDTYDDAIGLNGQDYVNSNPEMGWIENGVIENCYDMGGEDNIGNFCRMLAGGWTDWQKGMEVQHSDAVISNGCIYRVQMVPDGTVYKSQTRPLHDEGNKVIDNINWSMMQTDVTYTAGVRNITFRNIFLEKARTGFAIHFDNNKFSRSYYPGAEIPIQKQLIFDNIKVCHNNKKDLMAIRTPVDNITISSSVIGNTRISFYENKAVMDYFKTNISFIGCTFLYDGSFTFLENKIKNKEIIVNTYSSMIVSENFKATINKGEGRIAINSDLIRLNE